MVYVLKSRPYPPHHWDGYYTGGKYRFQGEEYATADTYLPNAKKYKTQKLAERACDSLNRRVCNYIFDVAEVEEDEAYL